MFRPTLFVLMVFLGIAFPPLLIIIAPLAIIIIVRTAERAKTLSRQRDAYYQAVSDAERARLFR